MNLRRALKWQLALIATLALALSTVAISAHRSHHQSPRPVTLEAALAAITGSSLYWHIDSILGESTTDRHANDIEIDSIGWGVTNVKGTAKGAAFSDISIDKQIDRSSPQLMLATAAGTNLGTTTIAAEKAGGQQFRLETLTLANTVLTGWHQTGAATGYPETVSLHFTQLTLTYNLQKADGSASPQTACWNLPAKTPC